jgi:hypothetical protein
MYQAKTAWLGGIHLSHFTCESLLFRINLEIVNCESVFTGSFLNE